MMKLLQLLKIFTAGCLILPAFAFAENESDMLNETMSRYEVLNYVTELHQQTLQAVPKKTHEPSFWEALFADKQGRKAPVSDGTATGTKNADTQFSFGKDVSSAGDLDLWKKVRKRFSMPNDISPEAVARFERFYQNRPDYFQRIILRGSPYFYHILNETEKRRMPGEVVLLPIIESAFVTHAKSHVGASGIWQFMPKTGKNFGLKQNHWYDGRNDVYAATDAALDYLQYLHNMFGDWALAFAAYNCGEGRVESAQRKAINKGLDPVFDNLDLPRETRDYVPKLLAVRNLVAEPGMFNVELKKIANKPYFEAVNIDQPMDMEVIADLAGISDKELAQLNPGYRIPVWVPQKGRKLLLPKKSIATFKRNLSEAEPKSLLSWKPIRVTDSNIKLSELASQYGMTLSELKQVNMIKGDKVNKGAILLVSDDFVGQNNDAMAQIDDDIEWEEPTRITTVSTTSAGKKAVKKKSEYGTITVKKGMTLGRIAQRYGMTLKELKRINGLKSNRLSIGKKLKVKAGSSSKKVNKKKNVKKKNVKKKTVNKKTVKKKTAKKSSSKKKK